MPLSLWVSAEIQDTVEADYRRLAKPLEARINSRLGTLPEMPADKWTFIAILLLPDLASHYPEQMRFSAVRRAIECKVSIDYETFLRGDSLTRIDLIAQALLRSMVPMSRARIPIKLQEEIKEIVLTSAEEEKARFSQKH